MNEWLWMNFLNFRRRFNFKENKRKKMADEESGAQQQRRPEEGGRLNTLFIKSPIGILLIVNFVSILIFLCSSESHHAIWKKSE